MSDAPDRALELLSLNPPPENIRARMAELELRADPDEKALFTKLWEGVDIAEEQIGIYAEPKIAPDAS